jgi:hypothetical protein
VYGCECWWGPEEQIKLQVANAESKGYEIIMVSIDEIRKDYDQQGEV